MAGEKVDPQGEAQPPAADRTENDFMKEKSGHSTY